MKCNKHAAHLYVCRQKLSILIVLIIGTLLTACHNTHQPKMEKQKDSASTALNYFDADRYVIDSIPNAIERSFIKYGKELTENTSRYLGPEVKNKAMRYAGNNLACTNCHLNNGMRKFAAPFIGTWGNYPNFRKRENSLGTMGDRINGCMTRSMNGKPLPRDSKEMKAFKAYIKFLSKDVPTGQKLLGQGFPKIKFPHRAADPAKGKIVFKQKCASCHGEDGQGMRRGEKGDAKGYLYPPLWGPDSFNDGAGMHRELTAARFIKANMPYGTPVGAPVLSDEQAYDVAAYINSFSRPEKSNKEKDYPNLKLKPIDCPYPPYSDSLSTVRHKLGPFITNI